MLFPSRRIFILSFPNDLRQTLIVPRLAQLSFSFHKILIRLNIHGNKISNNLIFHRLISQTIIIDSTVPYIKPPTILHLVPFLVADGYPFFPSIGDRILADPRISWVLAVRNDNDSGWNRAGEVGSGPANPSPEERLDLCQIISLDSLRLSDGGRLVSRR